MESISPLACAFVVLGAPLAGTALVVLASFRTARLADWIGLLAAVVALAGAGLLTAQIFADQRLYEEWFVWIAGDELKIGVGLLGDRLSAGMLAGALVAGVVVHGYTLNRGEKVGRVVTLQISAFSVALVLLGDGYGLLYVGWALLGLCAYFSIEDHQREEARRMGWKVRAIDRGGETALVLGIAGLLAQTGRLDSGVVEAVTSSGETSIWIGALLLLAAAARFAQVFLYVRWSVTADGAASVRALFYAIVAALTSAHLVMRSWPLCPTESAPLLASSAVGTVGLLICIPTWFVRSTARFVRDMVDALLIDLVIVGGIGLSVRGIGWLLACLQTGRVRFYLLSIATGTGVVLFYLTQMR